MDLNTCNRKIKVCFEKNHTNFYRNNLPFVIKSDNCKSTIIENVIYEELWKELKYEYILKYDESDSNIILYIIITSPILNNDEFLNMYNKIHDDIHNSYNAFAYNNEFKYSINSDRLIVMSIE